LDGWKERDCGLCGDDGDDGDGDDDADLDDADADNADDDVDPWRRQVVDAVASQEPAMRVVDPLTLGYLARSAKLSCQYVNSIMMHTQ
jgi:hypothetical protein